MRLRLLISIISILIAPMAACGQAPIVPVMTITLDPTYVNVTTTSSEQANVEISGTVQLDKLPIERIVVSLTSSVDAGWASQCAPSSMVITDETIHTFTCSVSVPQASSGQAKLTVDGKGQGGGFSISAEAVAIISAEFKNQSSPTPSTQGNPSQPSTSGHSSSTNASSTNFDVDFLRQNKNNIIFLIVVVIIASVSLWGYKTIKKRRRLRSRRPEEYDNDL